MIATRYETDALLSQYLLFHYGSDEDLMPYAFGPKNSLHFPERCVEECLDCAALSEDAQALELGCAVGRSSFELTKYCRHVTAIDSSSAFISAAKQMQRNGRLEYALPEEGPRWEKRLAELPQDVHPDRVEFIVADAVSFSKDSAPFDIVLAANLLCRLTDPSAFLKLLRRMLKPNGQLILISPYSWLEEFTPKSNWVGTRCSALEEIKELLGDDFNLKDLFDMPFLMREHYRKYQWGVSQATIWRRA